jgi:transcriptional regulator with XRE-family HTH domain
MRPAAPSPTLDVLRKLAIALSVSSDTLVFDAERNPDEELRLQLEAAQRLTDEDRQLVKRFINGLLLSQEAKRLAASQDRSRYRARATRAEYRVSMAIGFSRRAENQNPGRRAARPHAVSCIAVGTSVDDRNVRFASGDSFEQRARIEIVGENLDIGIVADDACDTVPVVLVKPPDHNGHARWAHGLVERTSMSIAVGEPVGRRHSHAVQYRSAAGRNAYAVPPGDVAV